MQHEYDYQAGDQHKRILVETENGRQRIQIGEQVYTVEQVIRNGAQIEFIVDGRRLRAYVAQEKDVCYVALDGHTWAVHRSQQRPRRATGSERSERLLTAPMPGAVTEVRVQVGDAVAKGDTLVRLEAMKMELRITAPQAGQVKAVHCALGDIVQRGQVLVELGE